MPSSRDGGDVDSSEDNHAIAFKDGESMPDALLRALRDDLAKMGGQAISLLRTKHPQDYVKIILSLRAENESKKGAFDDVDDEELRALVLAARAALQAAEG